MEAIDTMENTLFLEALKASLGGEKVAWSQELPEAAWQRLFTLAQQHHVLPLVYDAVYCCPAALRMGRGFFAPLAHQVMKTVMLQTMKTSEFLALYRHLTQSGLHPVLVKGLVCRTLYPNPDLRISGDEDLLIGEVDFAACHGAMLSFGMVTEAGEEELETAYEIPYRKNGSPLYIELHRHLFSPESNAIGDLNRQFADVQSRTISLELQGTPVRAMAHTDHLFYLICHAFKHFLYSGFGIRQVCDIILYANAYGSQIDWQSLYDRCVGIRAERFVAALLRIGEKYLTFSPDRACCPARWREMEVDETAMLADLLSGGVYGGATMSRRHSSSMTLEAVAAQKQGAKSRGSLCSALFPPARKLEGRYPYLKKYPVLLPVAWCSRILRYGRETMDTDSSAAEAMKIGKDRIKLLRFYQIIE